MYAVHGIEHHTVLAVGARAVGYHNGIGIASGLGLAQIAQASSVQPFSMMMVISAMARRPSVAGAMGTHRLHFAAEEEYAGSMK